MIDYAARRRSKRIKTPVVMMNCSGSSPDSKWTDPAGPIAIPRAINFQDYSDFTVTTPAGQENRVIHDDDVISVLTNPVVEPEKNENRTNFIGSNWGHGVTCLCSNKEHVVPQHRLPSGLPNDRRPENVQCLAAKFNNRRDQIVSMARDMWDMRGDEGMNPTKRWSVVYNMLNLTTNMIGDVQNHLQNMTDTMDAGEGFDYNQHKSGDSISENTVREMRQEYLNDEITQVAATTILAGSMLLGLGTDFPESSHETIANELIESLVRKTRAKKCSTCGNGTELPFLETNRVLAEIACTLVDDEQGGIRI